MKALQLRVLCFLACVPSGGALLAKVYGLASMQVVVLGLFVPCSVLLLGVWQWARQTGRDIVADALLIGTVGGLLGTVAYDLIRVPFLLAGQRVFAPISAYGVWVLDAPVSSRFTEVTGWAYHFSNGITFGIMYALFMRGRHWGWAILWAFLLETIAIVSPFARIFALSGNYTAIGIAYLGHVAYGYPLGWLVQHWDETRDWMKTAPRSLVWTLAATAVGVLFWVLLQPASIGRDVRAVQGTFRVEGSRLNPDWVRTNLGESVELVNPEPAPATVHSKMTNTTMELDAGAHTTIDFPKPGIYQLYVETDGQTRSSFAIVEPVEQFDE